jgi:hypothetical protein
MSQSKTPEAVNPEHKTAADANAHKSMPPAELKDSDLEKVAGGLNPQPLPPRAFGSGHP